MNPTNKYKWIKTSVKALILGLLFFSMGTLSSFAQMAQANSSATNPTKAEQEIIDLYKRKR